MKIKFTCNWCDDRELYTRILINYAINDEYFDSITYKNDFDYLVIINDIKDYSIIKSKETTFGLVMEPSWSNFWNKNLHDICSTVLFHDKSLYNKDNVIEWINCGFMHDYIYYKQLIDNIPIKTKNISAVFGIQNDLQQGYKLRKTLVSIIQEKKLDVNLYGKSIHPLLIKYNGIIDYKFSICIENSFEKNYISEKLYDCFMCNTVPIYCGAPNIDEIFSHKQIIKVNNENEICEIIDKINKKQILFEDFDIQSARKKYIEELNLITQIFKKLI